jgi:hypothetical protein
MSLITFTVVMDRPLPKETIKKIELIKTRLDEICIPTE